MLKEYLLIFLGAAVILALGLAALAGNKAYSTSVCQELEARAIMTDRAYFLCVNKEGKIVGPFEL